MEKVNKKEIRLVFNLNNERDKEIYEAFKDNTQPGKIIKKILKQYLDRNKTSSNIESSRNNNELNIELLKVLNKLNDKIDNLTVLSTQSNTKSEEKESIVEVELTADVFIEDIDDIDF